MTSKLIILGSTGSIGTQTLDVVQEHVGQFEIVGLSAGNNIELLHEQIAIYKPVAISVKNKDQQVSLQKIWPKLKIYTGPNGLAELITNHYSDLVVIALGGFLGLKPAITAINLGRDIALATKEVLVAGGEVIMPLAKKQKVKIYPIDSEHSALWQCLQGYNLTDVKKVTLTASGGPFFRSKLQDLKQVTINQALAHPNWQMGMKISIDSATMMNKALEVIEAYYLFNLPPEKIAVIIHPQSIVHALVEFNDGAILAQMSRPDMRLPIQYAITKGQRIANSFTSLDLTKCKKLAFYEVKGQKFAGLQLAYQAIGHGGTMPTVLNTANEVAVEAFLNNQIPFLQIVQMVKKIMNNHQVKPINGLEDILQADEQTRSFFKLYSKQNGDREIYASFC